MSWEIIGKTKYVQEWSGEGRSTFNNRCGEFKLPENRIQKKHLKWTYNSMKKIGGILYVKRLLGDVVHGFRQMSNVPRRDSSHGDTTVLNNYLAP